MHAPSQQVVDTLANSCRDAGLPPGMNLVVACSAGLDSTVLLKSVVDWISRNPHKHSVEALHVQHNLRSADEGEQDKAILSSLCREWGVALSVCMIPEGVLADYAEKHRCGMEAAARHFRYKKIISHCKKKKEEGVDSVIMTAHHADDQTETLFMRFCQGNAPDMLSGIAPRTNLDSFVLLRPLLSCSRELLVAASKEWRLPYHYDKTNDDETYRRNFLRRKILPPLKTEFPSLKESLGRLADEMSEIHHMIESMAMTLFKETGQISFHDWKESYSPVRRAALVRLIEAFYVSQFRGDLPERISGAFVREAEKQFLTSRTYRDLQGPGFILRRKEDHIEILPVLASSEEKGYLIEVKKNTDIIPEEGVLLRLTDVEKVFYEKNEENEGSYVTFAGKDPFYLRNRQTGDDIHGFKKTEEVVSLLIDSEGEILLYVLKQRDKEFSLRLNPDVNYEGTPNCKLKLMRNYAKHK